MAEEVKKAKKPRAAKKSAQGENVPQEAVEVAAVAEETAVKTAVEKAAVAEETKKKAPAKRTRKKAETAVKTEETESIKTEAEQQPEAAQPAKKKASKKQAKEAVKEEVKTEETAVIEAEEKVVAEVVAEPVIASEKTEEKPAKKAQKTAKKSQKNGEKTPEKEEKKPSKKAGKAVVLTRAQKKEIVIKLTKEILKTECKWADLVDRVALRYQEEYPTPENANLNDVKGRVGSVLYVMQEAGEIVIEGNLVKLPETEAKPEKESTVSALNDEKQAEIDLPNKEDTTEKAEENTAAVQAVCGDLGKKL